MPAGKKIKLLIADDEKNVSLVLQKELARRNYEVSVANDGRSAVEFAQKVDYDVIVMDMTMPQMDGIQALKVIKQGEPSPEVIMLTGNATLETAIEAMKAGAYDYLTKPCKIEELDVLIRKACERRDLQKDNLYMQTRLSRKESAPLLVTNNRKMKELLTFVERMAATDSSALILGESGTGKELIAQSFHRFSPRRAEAFIDINCGAIQETLLESEMFGYEKGAFTNADTSKPGLFELADRGTLFLDEVGELSPRLQVKLLRVLEAHTFFRVGGVKQVKVDFRLVAATNKNLLDEVQENRFRQDLLYRMNTVTVEIPALRERVDDIPLLVKHFTKKSGQQEPVPVSERSHGTAPAIPLAWQRSRAQERRGASHGPRLQRWHYGPMPSSRGFQNREACDRGCIKAGGRWHCQSCSLGERTDSCHARQSELASRQSCRTAGHHTQDALSQTALLQHREKLKAETG